MIGVRMGRRRRLPNLTAYQGARAADVVSFLNRKGFLAEIIPSEPKGEAH
jgi:hypothetical protein